MSDLDFSRRQIIESAGTLVVGFAIGGTGFVATAAGAEATVRTVVPESLDSWLAVARDDTVTLFTGRVDLGTGTETVSLSSWRMSWMFRSGRSVSSWAIPG